MTDAPAARQPPTVKKILARQAQDAQRDRVRPPPVTPPPTTNETNARQKADAERDLARQSAVTTSPQRPLAVPAVAADPLTAYLDEIAPASIAGRLVKFDKSGRFITADDGEPIDDARDFVALCDETLIGWIKFDPDGIAPPERHAGLRYDGFVMPPRETLGDLDEAEWPAGLSGAPTDPWQHQILLVLEDRTSHELFTFATSSKTGRKAVGNLLRYYDRISKQSADAYPITRLKAGGFNHKDPRIGWVPVPNFAIVGRAPKASAAKPDSSPSADMGGDSIPF